MKLKKYKLPVNDHASERKIANLLFLINHKHNAHGQCDKGSRVKTIRYLRQQVVN